VWWERSPQWLRVLPKFISRSTPVNEGWINTFRLLTGLRKYCKTGDVQKDGKKECWIAWMVSIYLAIASEYDCEVLG